MRLSGLGRSGLSSCSFCRNSRGRRISMGSESRLLMSYSDKGHPAGSEGSQGFGSCLSLVSR